ncbi:MAG: Rieske (2Fe-2S) protein [Planctomycetota bacterium]
MSQHQSGPSPDLAPAATGDGVTRRGISVAGAAMAAGLAAGYGTFAWMAGRFLLPAQEAAKGWLFVARLGDLEPGQSLRYRTPAGALVNITRRGAGAAAEDFIALSSTCPHLGCQVHWQQEHNRYFCPCHNGVFDPTGKATGGPPGDAGQSLKAFALRVEAGLLYIEVPLATLAGGEARGEVVPLHDGPEGPGHDPCLQPRCCGREPGFPA